MIYPMKTGFWRCDDRHVVDRGGQATTIAIMSKLFLPSFVNLLVPLVLVAYKLDDRAQLRLVSALTRMDMSVVVFVICILLAVACS